MPFQKLKLLFNNEKWAAFTLIEVYIALVVFSIAGLTLISMNASYLRQSVINEFRSQLESFAGEGLAEVQHLAITDWQNIPKGSNGMYYLKNVNGKTILTAGCTRSTIHDPLAYLAGKGETGTCESLQQAGKDTFLRGILITDYNTAFTDTQMNVRQRNGKNVEVWVSCAWGKCDGKLLPPYKRSIIIFEK